MRAEIPGAAKDITPLTCVLLDGFSSKSRRFLELTFEGFNLFNTVNYNGINNIVGTACVAGFATNPNCAGATTSIPINARGREGVSPTSPLGFTSTAPARQFQLGARFNF